LAHNGLNQLKANVTAENIRSFMNKNYFNQEQEEAVRDRVTVEYASNSDYDTETILSGLATGKFSIFKLINENAMMPRSTDRDWLHKLKELNKDNIKLHTNKLDDNSLKVSHSHGDVNYNVVGWTRANIDHNLTYISSENQLVDSWFTSAESTSHAFVTNILKFTESLNHLMEELGTTTPQIIFSFVPNHNRSTEIDYNVLLAQVTENQIWDSIKQRRLMRGRN